VLGKEQKWSLRMYPDNWHMFHIPTFSTATAVHFGIVKWFIIHVRWVPCHQGMTRPQVADGGKASGYGR
jgi:hypothetical protein